LETAKLISPQKRAIFPGRLRSPGYRKKGWSFSQVSAGPWVPVSANLQKPDLTTLGIFTSVLHVGSPVVPVNAAMLGSVARDAA
jgi:hypothetical protein